MDTTGAAAVGKLAEREQHGESDVSDDDKPTTGKTPAEPAGTTDAPAPTTTDAPAPTTVMTDGGDAAERMDLPKWNRARVKRSQPAAGGVEPDAFQQGVREAGRTAVKRGPLVLGAVVLIAGAIAGGIWWRGSRAETTAVSTRMLAVAVAWRARGVVDAEAVAQVGKHPPRVPLARDAEELQRNVDEALAQLEGEDAEARTLALLVRAATQQEHSDFAGAVETYRQFLAKAGETHALAFLAREGLALALEGTGDTDGALAELEKLAGAQGDFYRDMALWQRGRLLEQLGRKDEALEVYRLYATEYPLTEPSIARTEVRKQLGELDPTAVPPEKPPGLGGLVPP